MRYVSSSTLSTANIDPPPVGGAADLNDTLHGLGDHSTRRSRRHSHDRLPRDHIWLTCEAFDAAGVWSPVFSIDAAQIADPDTRARVVWQFDQLELASEYQEAAGDRVSGRLREWSTTIRDGGVATLARQLHLEMMSEADKNGASHWKAVTLRGILADPRFHIDRLPLFGNPRPFPGDWR